MKLYTEEQVRQIINRAELNKHLTYGDVLDGIFPIELPSDEEIENDAKKFVLSHNFSLLTNSNHLANRCFQLGAKWIKEQILKQNK
jgi:hypothetical protein